MSNKKTTYYKVLTDGKSCNGGELAWALPRGKRPGAWVETTGTVALCCNGIHVVDADHILDWSGNQVWEIEVAGDGVTDGKKWAYPRARLLRLAMGEDALRHFAVACAARVLPLFERDRPEDMCVRDCLIACGPGSYDVARKVAWDVAWDVARAAARAAAGTATMAAVRAAARAAAGDATRAAVRAAAWAAAGDATRDAAGPAAWAAAGAAAGAVARAVAGDATRAAARAAEWRWQNRALKRYLAGRVDLLRPVKLPPRPKR